MTAIKYNFTMSLADVDKAIPSLASRATSLKTDMHKVLVSLLCQWAKSGDARQITGRMGAIVNAEPYYGQAIVNWAGAYAGFEWDSKAKTFTYTRTTIDASIFQQAKAEPFYEFSPAPEPKAYKFNEKLEALLSGAVKRSKKPIEGDVIPDDLLSAVYEAMETWKEAQAKAKGDSRMEDTVSH